MKRIGIDARLINQTGVGVYTRNLLYHLDKSVKDVSLKVYLRDEDIDTIDFSNKLIKKKRANYQWHSVSEQTGFLRLLNSEKLDLMHFTYFSYPTLYTKPFVMTIHDLIPLIHSTGRASTKNNFLYGVKKLGYSHTIKTAVKKSKAIIVPTNHVKNSIVSYFGNNYADKIETTYEGISQSLTEAKENKKLYDDFDMPFFLYVGNFYPHKNVETLLRAFAKSTTKAHLVLVGPDDYFSSRLHTLARELKTEKIHFYHNPEIEDFVFFYKNAKALLHPSLAEGFGLPLIEASYFSCPIVGSNIDVFKEILRNKYLQFDPRSIQDIKAKIDKASNLKKTSSYHLSKTDIENKFSFKKMAKQTFEIYKNNL